MSADKYPSILSRQMEAIVYIFPNFQNCARCEKDLKSVRFLGQIMSMDKYPSIFSRQMDVIVGISDIERNNQIY